ncbi:hypothetical protein BDF20DRAFT_986131 [Mycotypha africana]|uniref:uncharacterized protein n=1 Tax=Mycotypha africana TaxID=64632 RepID=UPI002300DD5A|nr:uncharacterized protein BDF20DRAFT_986131 [Mycotypha africana]KAI8984206.1 hypothetical protein BDF20DRAFT_986131 [Mycotypha africana]
MDTFTSPPAPVVKYHTCDTCDTCDICGTHLRFSLLFKMSQTNSNLDDDLSDVLTITLPRRPGADLSSKLLFREDEIVNIVVKAATDGHVNGSLYCVSSNEFSDGRKSDILYIPKTNKPTETTLPIIVEIQQIVDISFIKRINRYCLNVHDAYKVFPKVIVFVIKGFSSKALMNDFAIEEGYPYYTTHKQYWAHFIQFYSLDSISSFVTDESTMTPIIALSYFLCSQQKSIMALDESEDEELRKIYKIAYRSFLQYATIENTLTDLANDVLDKTNKQFEKIVNCAHENSESSLRAYAKNGLEFTEKRRKLFFEKEQDATVTPIEIVESADLFFVKNFRNNIPGRMNWSACYTSGLSDGLFSRFGSPLSLKDAFLNDRL